MFANYCGEWAWHPHASMIHSRSNLGVVVLEDKLHAVGGVSLKGTKLRSAEYFCKFSLQWTIARWTLTALRARCSAVVIDELLYIFGGDRTLTFNEINPASESSNDLPYVCRGTADVAITASKERIYVACGGECGVWVSSLHCYDPATGIWETIPRPDSTSQAPGSRAVVFDRSLPWPYIPSTPPKPCDVNRPCRYMNPDSPSTPESTLAPTSSSKSYSDILSYLYRSRHGQHV